eukprot:Rhum_TRINITY_DN17237_c0_g1::Rhum_TRINITY_DN17237_c0_g1_i1::g.165501::m.165501
MLGPRSLLLVATFLLAAQRSSAFQDICETNANADATACLRAGCSQSGSKCNRCNLPDLYSTQWVEWNGHYYRRRPNKREWGDAHADCAGSGGYLVVPETQAELNWLAGGYDEDLWIGVFKPSSGSTSCRVTQSSNCYTPSGAPCPCNTPLMTEFYGSNPAFRDDKCLLVSPGQPVWDWSNQDCDDVDKAYVCERDTKPGGDQDSGWSPLGYENLEVKLFDAQDFSSACARGVCDAAGGTLLALPTQAVYNTYVTTFTSGGNDAWIGASVVFDMPTGPYPLWLWESGQGFIPRNGVYQNWEGNHALTTDRYPRAYMQGNDDRWRVSDGFSGVDRVACQRVISPPAPTAGKCTTALSLPSHALQWHAAFTSPGNGEQTLTTESDGDLPGVKYYSNSRATFVAGKQGTAIAMNPGTLIQFPSNMRYGELKQYPSNEFTICLWLKLDAGTSRGALFGVNYMPDQAGVRARLHGYGLVLTAADLLFEVGGGNGGYSSITLSQATLGTDWNHLCVGHSGTTPFAYLNGVSTGTGTGNAGNPFVSGRTAARGLVLAGNNADGSAVAEGFTIDELMVFHSKLTPLQVATVQNNCETPVACDVFTCAAGTHQAKMDPATIPCGSAAADCTESLCCDPLCTTFSCDMLPNKQNKTGTIPCLAGTPAACDEATCCDPQVLCDVYTCPSMFQDKATKATEVCGIAPSDCDNAKCCDAQVFCDVYTCPSMF